MDIIEIIKNAPKKEITPADTQKLLAAREQFKTLPDSVVRELFHRAAIRASENVQGIPVKYEFFIQDATGKFSKTVAATCEQDDARIALHRPDYEDVTLLIDDFSLAVQFCYSIRGDVDKGFVGYPTPSFYTAHIITCADGQRELGTGIEQLDLIEQLDF